MLCQFAERLDKRRRLLRIHLQPQEYVVFGKQSAQGSGDPGDAGQHENVAEADRPLQSEFLLCFQQRLQLPNAHRGCVDMDGQDIKCLS